ncbi:CopG family transcriptional regulator [Halomonas aestuarii]|uniref:CopG family transcriptional regulator n=1 Tax=Halomonas aestuarii TaxID=1897729 RepID=A0A1J0VFA6_9GAMM|nr:CopG family transcriptional regulator [Halomonas aestuarii]APE30695.1 CopG family transcriptional regulator [Halomonas aestuarii]
MEKKTARLTLLIDPHKKRAFEQLCAAQDLTPSQVVRQMIRDYLRDHGVAYETGPDQATREAPGRE